MTIVHVFKDFYPPTVGGIEQHLHLLCRTLARMVPTVVLVPSRSRRTVEECVDGIRVIRVPEFGRYASAPLCPTLPLWLRRLQPDIVHLHFPNPMGDLGYLTSRVDSPLVVTYHADIIKQRRLLPAYRPVLKLLFDRARRIIATSPDYIASSSLLSQYADRTVVVPFGVDPARLCLRDEEVETVQEIRRRHHDRLVLFVGVLRYYKGVDVLLRAMRAVNGHAIVVGRGADQRGLRELATSVGVAERVTFAGEIGDDQLRILLHAADVFALPSIDRCEAFGIAQLEAMACGTPIVSSDLPTGVRFVNQDGVTGFRVPPGDAQALATALNRVLDDRVLAARLGQAARARVAREFTAELMTARTLDVYRQVLSSVAMPEPHCAPAPRPQIGTPA